MTSEASDTDTLENGMSSDGEEEWDDQLLPNNSDADDDAPLAVVIL